jgi:hypothetical protein
MKETVLHAQVLSSGYHHSLAGVVGNLVLGLVLAGAGVALVFEYTPGVIGHWAEGRRIRRVGGYLVGVAAFIVVATLVFSL